MKCAELKLDTQILLYVLLNNSFEPVWTTIINISNNGVTLFLYFF